MALNKDNISNVTTDTKLRHIVLNLEVIIPN